MYLAIKDGRIAEWGESLDSLINLDDTHELVEWNDPLPTWNLMQGHPLDPRTPAQKIQDTKERYRKRRLREYPSVVRQLDMMHKDAVDGTTTWVDEISRIKAKYPKPE